MEKIRQIDKHQIYLRDDTTIPIAKSPYTDTKKRFFKYMRQVRIPISEGMRTTGADRRNYVEYENFPEYTVEVNTSLWYDGNKWILSVSLHKMHNRNILVKTVLLRNKNDDTTKRHPSDQAVSLSGSKTDNPPAFR